jgi:hypothetical protein
MGGHFRGPGERGLERNRGNDVEADEGGEREGNGHSDEIDIDGQPAGGVWSGWCLILRACHDGVSCVSFGKKKNPRIAIYADTWVPEVSKLRFVLFA